MNLKLLMLLLLSLVAPLTTNGQPPGYLDFIRDHIRERIYYRMFLNEAAGRYGIRSSLVKDFDTSKESGSKCIRVTRTIYSDSRQVFEEKSEIYFGPSRRDT